MFMQAAIKLAPLLVMLVLAGCGGKGSIQPEVRPTAGDWETEEYRAQGGLALVKASSMYARGGTGKGVTVGLLDGGATPGHPGSGREIRARRQLRGRRSDGYQS